MNVVMFHSVGNTESNWYRKWLSVSIEQFEYFCNYLKNKKYNTLFLREWYDYKNHPEKINKKQVVLTFDDGYLDNWVYVFPILKKYRLKGTIFINPEFVHPSNELRLQYDLNKNKMISSLGFLNWNEIKEMDKSPYIDIQSHSMSHNHYFYSDKLIDIYQGQYKYDWLAWIIRPDKKPYYITEDQKDYVDKGYPIFEYGRALSVRRFIPSEKFIKDFIGYYNNYKNKLSDKTLLDKMKNFIATYNDQIGHYETDTEMENRYKYELFESKRILEEKLNKTIDFLCWPGGGYNELSLKLAEEAGYKASTVASWDKNANFDNFRSYKRIKRYGLNNHISFNKYRRTTNNKKILVQQFMHKNGSFYYGNLMRLKKIMVILYDIIYKKKKRSLKLSGIL